MVIFAFILQPQETHSFKVSVGYFIQLQDLKERIERVRENKNGDLTSEREFSEEMLEIRKAFVTIHGEMVLLKNYSSLNFAGNLCSIF